MINISDTQQLKTSVTYYGTGSQTNFDFPFDYLRKAFIHVTINDVEVSDYSIDSRTIIFDTAPSEGAIINIYRSTDTTRLVAWADASVLKASDMTISQVQQLHILEEGQDWSKLNSIYLDENDNKWQGNNHPMKNISDPVDAKDVVTKGYMETVQGGFVMTNTALKDEAAKQAGIATTKASEASASASAAATSETNAASSANTAKRWAEASDSPDNTTSKSAKTWASEAIGSASAAKTSETNAKASETAANTSKTEAQEAATLANSYANNAKSDASLAHTYMQSSQSNMNSTKNYMDNAKNYSENVNVFIPSVSDSGVLSWTNKAGLANPASVNIKGAKGDTGDTGAAATIEVGTVTTGAAGSSASVVNRGDANNAILDFILPKGADGKGSVITVNGKEPDAGGNVDLDIISIANGGTGANTAEKARENLGLATVASTGSYNDLSNKPTIPSAYNLPTASASVLGGIKVGSGLTISNGILSASGGGTAYRIPYGTCTSAGTTNNKVATISNGVSFSLTEGTVIAINFADNISNSERGTVTLNVNSTGAKPLRIFYNSNSWVYGGSPFTKYEGVALLIYTGDAWHLDSPL